MEELKMPSQNMAENTLITLREDGLLKSSFMQSRKVSSNLRYKESTQVQTPEEILLKNQIDQKNA